MEFWWYFLYFRWIMDYFSDLFFATADSKREWSNRMRNYPTYYGVQYIHSGRLYLRLDQQAEQLLEGPVAFLTCPEHFFEYGSPEGETRWHLWCCFQGPRMTRMIEKELFPTDGIIFTPSASGVFLRSMQELVALAAGPERNSDRAVVRLEELLLLMHESPGSHLRPPSPYAERLREMCDEIELHPEREWDFAVEARKLHISLNHFNRLFREYCRSSPRRAVIDARMRRAAELLLKTGDSLHEIALAVGLDNEFYLSRLFKQKYHLPPGAYRREFCGD